ncbi:hypothetical protein EC845_2535 [Comamonas sp. BIGb0124]|uniref:DUF5681 domain-containing protein n=1 Tax=Comamonas sp. BIGb0124 TaxID=2485130 RepID=UPI000F9E68B3|nr:DUF5681 domain-containing protein [Comamonas sp. BIGb0124]ROR21713.1 hypothetical protein EC845_2535 [Comamonas sp. BIGb0124]
MTSQTKRGRWKPGESGNPGGRKPGVGSLRASLADELPGILDTLVERATAGDVQAARLLLERALPAISPRDRAALIRLPQAGVLTDQARVVLEAVRKGETDPETAAQALSSISAMALTKAVNDLALRVAALEQQKALNVDQTATESSHGRPA